MSRLRRLLARGSKFEIEADDVVCGVRGTTFEIGFEGAEIQMATEEGVVEVSYASGVESVAAGYYAAFSRGRRLGHRKLAQREKHRFEVFLAHHGGVQKRRAKRLLRAEEKAHKTLQQILDSGDEEDVSKTQAVLDLILFHIESKGGEA